jgi:BirA family biotin operon repressor/biotin-[acetyl-CoA-carboxylase] ligase
MDKTGVLPTEMLARLLAGERVLRDSTISQEVIAELGLEGNTREFWLSPEVKRLDQPRLYAALTSNARGLWQEVRVISQVASTNTALLVQGGQAVGKVLATEYQWQGRGRRGRAWLSPLARNIAVSCAGESQRPLVELAGLSLAVGLALVDGLRSVGVGEVQLKWPNDLLVAQADGFGKLGGILVELQSLPQGSLAVIGVGINYQSAGLTRARVDQAIADVNELHCNLDRTALLAGLLNALADYLLEFERSGFGPMVRGWESVHAFQDREVRLTPANVRTLGIAEGVTEGVVEGVEPTGELRLRTAQGVSLFNAGEVSLRAATGFASSAPSRA